jgi:HPt (histidine-containing phosphotransfer) domain-containing protein
MVSAPQQQTGVEPSASDPVIDRVALHKRFQGREDFIKKLMAIAIDSYQETPEVLRQAVRSGDLERLQFIAHSLKGVSGNLEARVLHRLALQVEGYAKQGDSQTGRSAIALASALDDLLAVLTQENKAS